jgi:hypothetical protein
MLDAYIDLKMEDVRRLIQQLTLLNLICITACNLFAVTIFKKLALCVMPVS